MVEAKALDARRWKKNSGTANLVEPASDDAPLSVEGTVLDPCAEGVFDDLGVPEGELPGEAAVKLS